MLELSGMGVVTSTPFDPSGLGAANTTVGAILTAPNMVKAVMTIKLTNFRVFIIIINK